MKSTSAETLEFESLRQLLGRFISSPLGRAELQQVAPQTDRAQIEHALAEAAEAAQYLRSAARPQAAMRGAAIRLDFSPFKDLTEAVHKLRIEGASLEPREIFDLIEMLDRAADMKSILTAAGEGFRLLAERGALIGDFRSLLNELVGKILPDGTVADHASAALARLRRDIEKQKKAIQESLERFLKAHHEEGILQEEFVTIRNERFVVPVISGQKRKIEGVIHGASASGHTLFVEPLETIELNNELVRLSEEELREVHRILLEMTDRLRGYADCIRATVAVLGQLELIFAKGRFALEFDCTTPRFSAEAPRLLLRDARHPLLEDVLRRQKRQIVPISLELNTDCRTLLISGPNTGGKTVALKTVGLLALMAQSGLPVPAAEAEFPIFGQVLADIGDNQSIQESLSTFSAHVSHIREMALDVTPDSLVLLDELGAATDPEEGGALGVAIVDHFRAAGAFTIGSTHLLALKIYGANTDGVINACMGFDENTLEPTYHLSLGLPGKSAGLDIATRLGMPEHIMRRARQSLSSREQDVAKFLAELHRRLEETAALEQELRGRLAAVAAREKELASIQEDARRGELARPILRENARVRLKGMGEPARVLRKLSNDRIEVEAGRMRLQVSLHDVLEVLPPAVGRPSLPQNVSFRPAPQLNPSVREINVIGQRAEEARGAVEKFLDSAVLATSSRVRIVHGHGMGVLRNAVWQLLAENPHVDKFYPAPQHEGGAGATIVELKE